MNGNSINKKEKEGSVIDEVDIRRTIIRKYDSVYQKFEFIENGKEDDPYSLCCLLRNSC